MFEEIKMFDFNNFKTSFSDRSYLVPIFWKKEGTFKFVFLGLKSSLTGIPIVLFHFYLHYGICLSISKDHLSHSGEVLRLVGICRHPSSIAIFSSRTTGQISTKFGILPLWGKHRKKFDILLTPIFEVKRVKLIQFHIVFFSTPGDRSVDQGPLVIMQCTSNIFRFFFY